MSTSGRSKTFDHWHAAPFAACGQAVAEEKFSVIFPKALPESPCRPSFLKGQDRRVGFMPTTTAKQ
jgi:hypothetical protein